MDKGKHGIKESYCSETNSSVYSSSINESNDTSSASWNWNNVSLLLLLISWISSEHDGIFVK